jgi:hypothetical protein
MAFSYYDRVKETSASTGTGNISLGGAVSQFRSFSSVFSNADNFYYLIADQAGVNWEVGVGTYNSSGNTLSRTAVLASTNSGSAVNFTSGALFVANVNAASAFVSATLASGSAISLTTATPANITSISLPPGDWDVSGNVIFDESSIGGTEFTAAINTTSATLPTAPAGNAISQVLAPTTGGVGAYTLALPVGPTRITITTTTTIYLVAQQTSSSGTTAYGFIQARRR